MNAHRLKGRTLQTSGLPLAVLFALAQGCAGGTGARTGTGGAAAGGAAGTTGGAAGSGSLNGGAPGSGGVTGGSAAGGAGVATGGGPGTAGLGAGGTAGHATAGSTGFGGTAAGGGPGAAGRGAGGAAGRATGGSTSSGGTAGGAGSTGAFVHPGLLHSAEDFDRMKTKVAAAAEPWKMGWDKLVANTHTALTWTARPAAMIYRGADGTHPENYSQLFNDVAAAYALALRWKISGDVAYAAKSIEILNAWAGMLTGISGTSDKFLASGLYGYQLANAAEIMRTYTGWAAADFTRFKAMMLMVFYPMNHDFLVRHNDACISHYWANWDLCNMASMIAIGVLVDDRAIYNEAVTYFKTGAGNGSIGHAVYYLHPGNLGQWQESGRDQGHNTLGIGLMGPFCEMAWKQGDDLYGYSQNRFLAGAEYVAQYNLGNAVPYQPYDNCDSVMQNVISETGRGDDRPIWEMVYNHYVNRRHLAAPNSAAYAAKVRPEGGGGNYGPNSGGYDQLGYGTLTFTLEP
jgi:hypothetical protein